MTHGEYTVWITELCHDIVWFNFILGSLHNEYVFKVLGYSAMFSPLR